jgi:hypothetical protein
MKLIYKNLSFCLLFNAVFAFGQNLSINGSLEWEKAEIQAHVSLELASLNIKLPAGRTMGESIIDSEYLQLLYPSILGLQADSSSTLADLVQSGTWHLSEAEKICSNAKKTPPYLSPDLLHLRASYTINLENVSIALMNHKRPAEVPRTLSPVSVTEYTGIIIIASSALPLHGMQGTAEIVPCLFPKIWDSNMKLIYEKSMLDKQRKIMVRYTSDKSIFLSTPSGLSPQASALLGNKPLRIIARGLFGDVPTDPIIDAQDALQIISSDNNRRLLSEGRVLIITDESALRIPFDN